MLEDLLDHVEIKVPTAHPREESCGQQFLECEPPGDLLEMQICGLYSRPIRSETLEVGFRNCFWEQALQMILIHPQGFEPLLLNH